MPRRLRRAVVPALRPSKPPSPPASWCVEARGLELVADQPKVQEHHPEVVLVSTCPLRARAAALPVTPRPAVNLVVYHGALARMRAGARRSCATTTWPPTPPRPRPTPGPAPTPGRLNFLTLVWALLGPAGLFGQCARPQNGRTQRPTWLRTCQCRPTPETSAVRPLVRIEAAAPDCPPDP